MNDKEYTYDIDKYMIGVDENGEDGIGMTVAKIENGGIKFLGNCYCENARCIDLLIKENQALKKQLEVGEQQYNDLVEAKEKLDAENQVLKDYKNVALTYMKNYLKMKLNYQNKDVAEHFKMIIDMLNRGNKHDNLVDITDCKNQQQEFINYLEKRYKDVTSVIGSYGSNTNMLYGKKDMIEEILQKYKEIIGDNKDE